MNNYRMPPMCTRIEPWMMIYRVYNEKFHKFGCIVKFLTVKLK